MSVLLVDVGLGSFYVGRKYEQLAFLTVRPGESFSVFGIVTAKTPDSITLRIPGGEEERTIKVSSSTSVMITDPLANHLKISNGQQISIGLIPGSNEANSILVAPLGSRPIITPERSR